MNDYLIFVINIISTIQIKLVTRPGYVSIFMFICVIDYIRNISLQDNSINNKTNFQVKKDI